MDYDSILSQLAQFDFTRELLPLLEDYRDRVEEADRQSVKTIDSLRDSREKFLTKGIVSDNVKPEIVQSWKRCQEAGLPTSHRIPPCYEGEEWKEIHDQYAYFINTAAPIIEASLKEALDYEILPLSMYVTDPKGTILYLSISSQFAEHIVSSMGMRVGAKWNETYIGTNSVSLSLEHKHNFTTTAYEHYMDEHSIYNCISALIHDNDGAIIGTLTMSYYLYYYNPLLTAFVYTTARLIEESMQMQRARGALNYSMNNSDKGLLVLDSNGAVIEANTKFYQMIRNNDAELKDLNINLLLRDFDWEKSFADRKLHASIGETFLNYQAVSTRVRVDAYLIDLYGHKDGYVLILQGVDDIISLSQKYTGSATVFRFDNIITQDPQMEHLIAECKHIANQNCSVLIEGESGTGKELFAESIHTYSNRSKGPFIAVNCAALPPSLVESELFGYEKGTFTDGLTTGKAGKFEQADGGTIFLDEIGELSLDIQAKLLRVLDNKRITRIGGNTEKKLDIRVIAATNRDLYDMMMDKSFREDLYYRLSVFSITLPPLNDRNGDIPLLVNHFLRQLRMENRGISRRFSEESMDLLENYHWNGNVRELQNAISRAYHLCDTAVIGPEYLPRKIRERGTVEARSELPASIKNHERDMILRALDANGWNVTRAARQLNISRATIYRKMKSLGISQE